MKEQVGRIWVFLVSLFKFNHVYLIAQEFDIVLPIGRSGQRQRNPSKKLIKREGLLNLQTLNTVARDYGTIFVLNHTISVNRMVNDWDTGDNKVYVSPKGYKENGVGEVQQFSLYLTESSNAGTSQSMFPVILLLKVDEEGMFLFPTT